MDFVFKVGDIAFLSDKKRYMVFDLIKLDEVPIVALQRMPETIDELENMEKCETIFAEQIIAAEGAFLVPIVDKILINRLWGKVGK